MNTEGINQFQTTLNSEHANNTMVSNSVAYTITQSEPKDHGNSMIATENESVIAPVTTDNEWTVIPSRQETPKLSYDHDTPEANTVCTGEVGEDSVRGPTDQVFETSMKIENADFEDNSSGNMDVIHVTNSDTGVQTVLRIEKVYQITSANSKNALAEPWEAVARPAYESHAEESDINHDLIDRNDDIDDLPEDIKAELTVQAEYYQSKSASGQVNKDPDQCEDKEIRNPECYERNPQASEIHATIKTEFSSRYEENECQSVSNSNSYFGSESSMFSLSNSSTNLEQLSQGHVVEEVTVSDELNDLGLDDRYFQDIAQEQTNEPIKSVKQTNLTNENERKMKKNSTCKKVTFIDASSISKITSLWAKTSPSPKPHQIQHTSPKKRGKTTKMISSTFGPSPKPPQIQQTTLKKRGRPKKIMNSTSGPSPIPYQIDASSISKITSLWSNTSPSPEPQQIIHTSAKRRGRPKKVMISTSGSSPIPSHIDATSIPKVTSLWTNTNPSSEPQQLLHTVPRKRGRPKKIINSTSESSPIPSEIDSSSISKVTSLWANTSPISEPLQLLLTSPNKRGRPKKIMNSTSESSPIPSQIDASSIPKVTSLLTNTSPLSEPLQLLHTSPKKRGRPKKIMNSTSGSSSIPSQIDASSIPKVTSLWANTSPCPEPQQLLHTVPRKRGRPKKIMSSTSSGMTNLVVNARNYKKNNLFKKTNEAKLLQKFKITPCRIELTKLKMDKAVVQLNVIGDTRQNVIESKPDTKKDQEHKSKDMDLCNTKLVEQRKKSEKKANHLKEEKNYKIAAMSLKLEKKSEPDDTFIDGMDNEYISFTDGFDDKYISFTDGMDEEYISDVVYVSEDEYTPTKPNSLKKAFVKSSKVRKVNKDSRRPAVKRKIELTDTTEEIRTKITKSAEDCGCGIGRPPVLGKVECHKCGFTSNQKELMKKHYKKFHAIAFKYCNYCDRRFKSQDCLLEHEATKHTKEKIFKCSVEECFYASSNRTDLSRHQSKHATEKSHVCTECGWTTKWPRNLRGHRLMVHTDDNEKKFKCRICTYECKRSADLKQHMFRHTDEKPIVCDTCGFRVKTNWELRSHMLCHSDEKPHPCTFPGCTAAAKTNADILKHMRKVHTTERNFVCSLCSKAYKDQQSLNKHHEYAHVQTRLFKCDICNKAFKLKAALRKHIHLHSGIKPFSCSVCQKKFATTNNMSKHMETHDFKSRPYRCPLCPYGAKESCHLLAHIGTFHGDSHCYFCELCKKPFERHSKLLAHYQRMHKSDLTRVTNRRQFDLALVKMEMELSQGEPKSKSSKRKLKKTKSKEGLEMKVKDEPLDDGYETTGYSTERIIETCNNSGPDVNVTETCMDNLPDTTKITQTADVNEMNQNSAIKDNSTSVNPSPDADEIRCVFDKNNMSQNSRQSKNENSHTSNHKGNEMDVTNEITCKDLMIDTEHAAQNIVDGCKKWETDIAENGRNASPVQLYKSIANGGFNSLKNNYNAEEDNSYHKDNKKNNEEISNPSNNSEEVRKELVNETGTINEESREKLVNETGTINGELVNEAGTVNEKIESEVLVTRNGSSFILALYNSLRLPLATKGFDFNYEKTGKKPKAWFMDTNLMNKKDARRHRAYLKRNQQMPRIESETKALKDFLKQRSQKRHTSMMKRTKQRDSNTNRGIPGRSKLYNEKYSLDVKRKKSTHTHKYTPEKPDQKDIVPNSTNNSDKKAMVTTSTNNSDKKAMVTKCNEKYSLDVKREKSTHTYTPEDPDQKDIVTKSTNNSVKKATVTKSTNKIDKKAMVTNSTSNSDKKEMVINSTSNSDTNTIVAKKKRGRPSKKDKVNYPIKYGQTVEDVSKKPTNQIPKITELSNSPSGTGKYKRKLKVDNTGEDAKIWNRKYISVKQRKMLAVKGIKSSVVKRPAKNVQEKKPSSANKEVKETFPLCSTDINKPSTSSSGCKIPPTDGQGNETDQGVELVEQAGEANVASNDTGERFQIPDINNFSDDTLVMKKYEHLHKVLGGITTSTVSESHPSVGEPSSTSFTGDDKKYLGYKVNVNKPETGEISKSGTE